ncbi:MAG: YkgJ family cysteine cluster protein [Promethearchaeota archaeon]
MRFECVHCGWCCISPNIVVTITHFDLYRLYLYFNSLTRIQEKIAFYVPKELTDLVKKQMHVPALLTVEGLAYLGLLKQETGNCVFYDTKTERCLIYPYRPLSCRTFPFAFEYALETKKLHIIFAEASKGTCKGIGKGSQISHDILRKLGIYKTKVIQDFEHVCKEINRSAREEAPLSSREILWVLISYAEKKQNSKLKLDDIGI